MILTTIKYFLPLHVKKKKLFWPLKATGMPGWVTNQTSGSGLDPGDKWISDVELFSAAVTIPN